jgi:hypothetical protein
MHRERVLNFGREMKMYCISSNTPFEKSELYVSMRRRSTTLTSKDRLHARTKRLTYHRLRHSHFWSSQVLRRSQEVGNDRTALLHPFEHLVQLLNTASRVRDELLLGRRTRIGRRKRVRADAGLSEHVGEGVHGLIERCQVRWERFTIDTRRGATC